MKTALVTGGSGGIGAAICQALAAAGYHVIVHANRQLDKAQAVVDNIRAEQGSADAVQFDLTDIDAVRHELSMLLEQHTIQVLVNNAGIHADAPLAGMEAAQWRNVIDTNLNGFFNVTQPLLLPMLATRWGRIINIASVAGITGNRGQCNYAASKAGLVAATKSLAKEVAKRGVTVNAVVPGIIDTDMSEAQFSEDMIRQLVPMQRAGRADEVAHVVAFLASDAASYINGQSVVVDGGMT